MPRLAGKTALITGAARYDHLDVRDEADWHRVTTALRDEFGALDIVVNKAGIIGFEAAPRCRRLQIAAQQRQT